MLNFVCRLISILMALITFQLERTELESALQFSDDFLRADVWHVQQYLTRCLPIGDKHKLKFPPSRLAVSPPL
ncbi:hypothetical protein C8J57DRAFT_1711249, partial [Mycena rebaudengoi]